ncbi:acyltransferase [Mesorhizobium sp. YM1C-6-2]|uniref:acyltransferase family protein n=1 Tax=Mesorhizobium sp. YM1C-6-2 TaxID=1827501 RepID=UPI000EF1C99B|nr:acyltransferase [Mesorhizobium sp. YM1C-6-2]RLP24649.1 acyltransferase [Mesorhizobium sp. YM1C-6-2]
MTYASTIEAVSRSSGSLSTPALEYNPALDGLRGLAALAVVGFHSAFPFMSGGFLGVDLFFVLSGFLITRLLRAEVAATGRIDVLRFYWRRALRLWPPLLAMLVLYACCVPLIADTDWQRDVLLAMFYLTDYSYPFWGEPELLRHTWSLSVEEHFYLVWPLAILLTRRIEAAKLAVIFFGLYVAATGWRIFDYWFFADWHWTYFRFDARLSGLMLGSIAGLIPWKPSSEAIGWAGLALLAILTAAMTLPSWFQFTNGTIAAEFASASVVLSAVHCRDSLFFRMLAWRPLVACGLLSYSIYLVHYPVVRVLREVMSPTETFTITAAISIALAAMIRIWIEKPLRRWRDRSLAVA